MGHCPCNKCSCSGLEYRRQPYYRTSGRAYRLHFFEGPQVARETGIMGHHNTTDICIDQCLRCISGIRYPVVWTHSPTNGERVAFPARLPFPDVGILPERVHPAVLPVFGIAGLTGDRARVEGNMETASVDGDSIWRGTLALALLYNWVSDSPRCCRHLLPWVHCHMVLSPFPEHDSAGLSPRHRVCPLRQLDRNPSELTDSHIHGGEKHGF